MAHLLEVSAVGRRSPLEPIGATREQSTWAGARRRREVLVRTADADDALRLVASYRMPEERSKSREE
jgi:hypothetical protein